MNTTETNLKASLLSAVSRRRRQKRVRKSIMGSAVTLAGVFLVTQNQWLRQDIRPLEREAALYEIVGTKAAPVTTVPQTQVEYVSNTYNVEIIPTEPLAVTIVTDSELESTFSDRAYALSHDSENQITAFHVLGESEL